MPSEMSRFTQLGDWIFEVKMVRALKVHEFGQPYQAVSTLTTIGDSLYIDSQLARHNEEFSREDCRIFYEFAKQLEMKHIQYDKVRNGARASRIINITENQPTRNCLN